MANMKRHWAPLSRRQFLRGASWATAGVATSAWPGPPRTASSLKDPGIQLWTVNGLMQLDAPATLAALRAIGYTKVESAGFGKRSAQEFRVLLDAAGLRCPSAHLDFLKGEPAKLFADAKSIGADYATSSILVLGTGAPSYSGLAPRGYAWQFSAMTQADAHKAAARANELGRLARRVGLRYAYHNHFFEFVPDAGVTAYDILLRETDPDYVWFEIDCGWMMAAGHDPVNYMERHPGRIAMIHARDFEPVPADAGEAGRPARRICTELGHGFIDYRRILRAAKTAGVRHCFAEQDGDFAHMIPIEAAKVAYRYLTSMAPS